MAGAREHCTYCQGDLDKQSCRYECCSCGKVQEMYGFFSTSHGLQHQFTATKHVAFQYANTSRSSSSLVDTRCARNSSSHDSRSIPLHIQKRGGVILGFPLNINGTPNITLNACQNIFYSWVSCCRILIQRCANAISICQLQLGIPVRCIFQPAMPSLVF